MQRAVLSQRQEQQHHQRTLYAAHPIMVQIHQARVAHQHCAQPDNTRHCSAQIYVSIAESPAVQNQNQKDSTLNIAVVSARTWEDDETLAVVLFDKPPDYLLTYRRAHRADQRQHKVALPIDHPE